MNPFPFRTTTNFEIVASHLERFHGITRNLASKRLHKFKEINGVGGADNVIFDYSGGVYNPYSLDPMGTLTMGGAKEWE